jgi:hypothetical protein
VKTADSLINKKLDVHMKILYGGEESYSFETALETKEKPA